MWSFPIPLMPFQQLQMQQVPPRQPFSTEEDLRLKDLVMKYRERNWKPVSSKMRGRTARQCRERYKYYLHPQILNAPSLEEEDRLLRANYVEMGRKWTQMTAFFNRRSAANLKNRWNTLSARDRSRLAPMLPIFMAESTASDSPEVAPPEPSEESNAPHVEHTEMMPVYGIELTADDRDSEESQRYRWELRRCFPGHFGDHW
jgi:hypothetical protein